MRSLTLLVLVLLAPLLAAEEEWKPRRDPAAVAKIEAAEKLVYLPRREALSTLKFVATLTKPGKHAAFDQPLGAFEVWLEEPEFLRIEERGSVDREAEEVLAHHDGKRCVLRDLVDYALWPYALYPNADLRSIGFAPKSKTKVRILDRHRTGLEVTFTRDGLPKQHTRYEKGKRKKFEKLEFAKHEGAWLLVGRTAQGGRDATRWHWEKQDGLWLPKSIDRTFGKAELRIDVEYVKVMPRAEGVPPVLPPRSDPADAAVLRRADRLVYDPVAEGLESARFRVTASDRRWKADRVFSVSFTAPDTVVVVAAGDDAVAADDPVRNLVELCFAKLVYRRPSAFPDLDDWLVTKNAEEEGTYLLSDRSVTEIDVRLFGNGALASWKKRLVDPVMTDHVLSFLFVDGKSLLETSRKPFEKSTLEWTWQKVDGFRLPRLVLHRHKGSLMRMVATEFEVTKLKQR